jgi:ribosomal protein L25 (general stress protein Ctc)
VFAKEASDFASWQEWVKESFAADPLKLSDKDKAWFKDRYDYGTSEQGKIRAARKPGDFAKTFQNDEKYGDNLSPFIQKMHDVLYAKDRLENPDADALAKEVERKLSFTPELKRAVDAYHTGTTTFNKADLLSYIRKNEQIVKYLYGTVMQDEAMKLEATEDIKYVPQVKRREILDNPSMSLAEQRIIIQDIQSEEIKQAIKDGSITIDMINSYISIHQGTFRLCEARDEGAHGAPEDAELSVEGEEVRHEAAPLVGGSYRAEADQDDPGVREERRESGSGNLAEWAVFLVRFDGEPGVSR